jgi:signal peptidase II
MRQNYQQHLLANSVLFLLLCALDRTTKSWALSSCVPGFMYNSWVGCELAFNRGISWSLFDSPHPMVFFLVSALIAAVIVCFLWSTYQQYRQRQNLYGATIILAGALSNFADRLLYGGVIDFIMIGSWPLFNVADICICLGILIMVIQQYE